MMDRNSSYRKQVSQINKHVELNMDAGNYELAIKFALMEVNLLNSVPQEERTSLDYWELDFAYYALAKANLNLKNYKLALKYTNAAIDALNHVSLAQENMDEVHTDAEKNVRILRKVYSATDKDELVIEACEASLGLLSGVKNKSLDVYKAMLSSLNHLITMNDKMDRYDANINLEDQLDELMRAIPTRHLSYDTLGKIGMAYNRIGDAWNELSDFEIDGESNPEQRDRTAQKKALEYFTMIDKGEQTEAIYRRIGLTHYYLAKNYVEAMKNPKALLHFILALEAWKDADDIYESDKDELFDAMLQLGMLLKDADSVEDLLDEVDQNRVVEINLKDVTDTVKMSHEISVASPSVRKTEISEYESMIQRSDEDNLRLGMLHYHQAQMYMREQNNEKACLALFDALFVWKELENIHNTNRNKLVTLLTCLGSYLQSKEQLLEMFANMENMSESSMESGINLSLSDAESDPEYDAETSLSSVESDAGSEDTDSYDARSTSSSRSAASAESSESSNVVSLQNSSTMFAGKRKRMTADERTLKEAQEFLKDHPTLNKVIHRR